jgi:hypothetical protein
MTDLFLVIPANAGSQGDYPVACSRAAACAGAMNRDRAPGQW